MSLYLLICLLLPVFFYSQNSNDQIIKEKIKQLGELRPVSKDEENKIISLANDLYYISKSVDNKNGMLVSLESQAAVYMNRGEANECLKVVSEGVLLAEELKNYIWQSRFLNFKARTLLIAGNYTDSRIHFSRAFKTIDLIKNKEVRPFFKAEIYQDLINYAESEYKQNGKKIYKDSVLYFAKKNYDESLKISEKIFPRKKYYVGQAARILGEVLVEGPNYNEGEKYINIAEKLLKNGDDNRLVAALYNAKGSLKFKEGDLEKALEYYQKALELSTNFHYNSLTTEIYNNFVKYYKKTGDIKQELYYVEKSKVLNDSLSAIHKNALITQSREDVQQANKKQQSDYKTWAILLIIGTVILTCLIFYYFYRKNKKRNEIKSNYLNLTTQKNDIDENKIALLLEMAKNNDKQFLIVFQEVFSDLHQELLKFHQLTSADLEMCAYLKLNIQTKEIAMYKKVSIGAVDNRKYRIRKKLNLLPESDLYKWINTIKT
ncbi:tetratricopeptide repeat protein [Elizabethkingia sp. HX QKY]|uniref:tetratricopeptide repeat protein n=1 Tax=Elizabethkingia TaxID=308865 RepID=UPI002A23EA34|nr:tetratricopeptide repeat protein [Elizabethkingia sp. HX QKY]MDX8571854.1 tetratricopeptide repeat protein [Elizabethkingia sp. HX QKY]